jgi:hypothetical protein
MATPVWTWLDDVRLLPVLPTTSYEAVEDFDCPNRLTHRY